MQSAECRRVVIVGLLLIAGCGSGGREPRAGSGGSDSLRVEGAFASAPPVGEAAAMYFTVHNPADSPDTLVHINTIDAAGASYHRSVVEGGLVQMQSMEVLEIPAGDSLVLRPGGTHIMLTGLKRRAGDTVHVSLTFAHAGSRLLVVPVLAPGDEPGAHQHE
ncbi:MAG TPA: copper chaperone PCu(A)C [Gemmatimonadales bacterium]|nr:copper chaperone PCu(A)C [Gemmatimonadales bacterium]